MNEENFDVQVLLERVSSIDPVAYAETRNFFDGAVTRLSPYITHGVISTREIAKILLKKHTFEQSSKLIYELMWREFFHRTWQAKGEEIFHDMRSKQHAQNVVGIPSALLNGVTGIHAIDTSIKELYLSGYIHNHARMWVAFLVANLASCRWLEGARWMYFHLFDGDLASNTLGWQWVAGTASNKKYIANQENINKFSRTSQRNTFLDLSYEELAKADIPTILSPVESINLETKLPTYLEPLRPEEKRLLLYHPWSLDPLWRRDESWDRLLILEPSHFQKYPISNKRLDFILSLAKQVPDLNLYVGEANEYPYLADYREIYFREYPACRHFPGKQDEREWIVQDPKELPQGFTKFWKMHEDSIRIALNG
jgi:deoxyribodipyrimidine photo-lyase